MRQQALGRTTIGTRASDYRQTRASWVQGPYSEGTPSAESALNQDLAVAQATIEPFSLWVTRQQMATDDIRFGHPPSVSAMPTDDGEREVQGWHSDSPISEKFRTSSAKTVFRTIQTTLYWEYNATSASRTSAKKLSASAAPTSPYYRVTAVGSFGFRTVTICCMSVGWHHRLASSL